MPPTRPDPPRRPDRRTTALRGAVAAGGLLAAIGALWALGDMLLPAMNARAQSRTWGDVVAQGAWFGVAGATYGALLGALRPMPASAQRGVRRVGALAGAGTAVVLLAIATWRTWDDFGVPSAVFIAFALLSGAGAGAWAAPRVLAQLQRSGGRAA